MNYKNMLVMAALSFISMYLLMYLMINSVENFYPNLNQVYMAGIMTIPMVIFELVIMHEMYRDKEKNKLILLGSLCLFALFLFMLRKQTLIGDKEFLKSMIPHHAGALLMCRESHIKDPEIQELCKHIMRGQQAEIDFMKAKLKALS